MVGGAIFVTACVLSALANAEGIEKTREFTECISEATRTLHFELNRTIPDLQTICMALLNVSTEYNEPLLKLFAKYRDQLSYIVEDIGESMKECLDGSYECLQEDLNLMRQSIGGVNTFLPATVGDTIGVDNLITQKKVALRISYLFDVFTKFSVEDFGVAVHACSNKLETPGEKRAGLTIWDIISMKPRDYSPQYLNTVREF